MNHSSPIIAPRALILAGPNGSGKTTFAREFLPAEGDCLTFINADLIAEGLSPCRAYLQMIREWQSIGYQVELIFLQLPSADMAVERVRQRVAQGGHNIPETDIRRRFDRGIKNFRLYYQKAVNAWRIYDASHWPPILIDEGVNP